MGLEQQNKQQHRALNIIIQTSPEAGLIIIMLSIQLSPQTYLINLGMIIKPIGMMIESACKRRV